ncbi:PIN domain-like protein [Mollisia scopiformis]|uniref:PIN domain-like protein n=1 Tax=Mollisia scopiformis TaxID=149040 RepID=A0A194X0I8_MOLSC|nr:PIN domain-like protein [Mollisia scopiformis]KUJ13713.1 PIN domain-like protein [Mollisia scopiformis]
MDIAAFAAQHFEQHQRPLRIAIDEAIWRGKFFLKEEDVVSIRRHQPAARPNEKNFLWRIVQLLRLNCQLVFVTDGPQRPTKRGKSTHGYNDHGLEDLKELIQELGCPWHRAPGEAEAECVQLQRHGHVDVVWTEDSDALMFGAHTLFRFEYKETEKGEQKIKKKDNYKVEVYRTHDILQKYSTFTREGLVLFAVLVGADYDKQGLFNVGPELAIQIMADGLGESLCRASDNGTLPAWRGKLEESLRRAGSKVNVPAGFPTPAVVKNYYRPIVSSEEALRTLQHTWWKSTFNDDTLRPILGDKYNLWIEEYIELIAPILLVRSLAQTSPGQEASNKCYRIERTGKSAAKNGPGQSKIRYTLSAVMSLDINAAYEDEYHRKPENRRKVLRPDQRPLCDAVLDCILRHAVPDVMENVLAAGSRKVTPRKSESKKRSLPSEDATKSASKKPVKKTKTKSSMQVEDSDNQLNKIPKSNGKATAKIPSQPSEEIQSSIRRETPRQTPRTLGLPGSDVSKNAKVASKSVIIDLISDDEDEVEQPIKVDKSIYETKSEDVNAQPERQPEKQPLDPTSPNSLRLARLRHFESKKSTAAEPPLSHVSLKQSPSGFVRFSFDSDDDD